MDPSTMAQMMAQMMPGFMPPVSYEDAYPMQRQELTPRPRMKTLMKREICKTMNWIKCLQMGPRSR